MDYYVFKLNLQPNILAVYRQKEELEYLISEEIPNVLESVLQVNEVEGFFKLTIENHSKEDFYKLFESLEEKTHKLVSEYKKILLNYRKTGEIHYTQDFLKLNEDCMISRRSIESKFPSIKKAYDIVLDEIIESLYELETDNQVGTGITHIKKFYKIKRYISLDEGASSIIPLELTSYYNPKTEHILVETDNIDAATNFIDAFELLINSSKDVTLRIGKININPVYKSFILEGEHTEVSYTLVYPNGNPPLDRHNILRDSEAKELHSTLVGPDGRPLKLEPINKMLEEEAKKGYLKRMEGKAKGVFSKIKKIGKLESDI
ncbi:hypothetical protein [Desemzia sp. FAM 23989]|uniref:hypothetical protein n=1 Tax=Desemzia sp. FAM 23989 TaxID=3259523 RepID=UPI003887C5C8